MSKALDLGHDYIRRRAQASLRSRDDSPDLLDADLRTGWATIDASDTGYPASPN